MLSILAGKPDSLCSPLEWLQFPGMGLRGSEVAFHSLKHLEQGPAPPCPQACLHLSELNPEVLGGCGVGNGSPDSHRVNRGLLKPFDCGSERYPLMLFPPLPFPQCCLGDQSCVPSGLVVKSLDSGVQIPAMPVISSVILGKLPNLLVLVSP